MNIVVYQCCDGSQRQLGESATRLAWCEGDIDFEAPISMGEEENWQIAHVSSFQSVMSRVQQIYFVYIYRDVKPDKSEWEWLAYKESHPFQALEIQISEIGGNFIGWTARILGDIPKVDEYIVSYGMKEDGTKITKVEPWFKTHLELFVSDDPDAAFSSIYLSYHKIKTVAAVAVAATVD